MSYLIHTAAGEHHESTDLVPRRIESNRRYFQLLSLLFLSYLASHKSLGAGGQGVGYYAYVRSLLAEHRLDFTKDWQAGNESFTMGRVGPGGALYPSQYTSSGRIDNHWAVGPSILWAPFEIPVHLTILTLQRFGFNVKPDGFSRPYIVAMALATAFYGFIGIYISFRFASFYVDERWAFLATLGLWFCKLSACLYVFSTHPGPMPNRSLLLPHSSGIGNGPGNVEPLNSG